MSFRITVKQNRVTLSQPSTGTTVSWTFDGKNVIREKTVGNLSEREKQCVTYLSKSFADFCTSSYVKGNNTAKKEAVIARLQELKSATSFRLLNNSFRRTWDDGTTAYRNAHFYEGMSKRNDAADETPVRKSTPAPVAKKSPAKPAAKTAKKETVAKKTATPKKATAKATATKTAKKAAPKKAAKPKATAKKATAKVQPEVTPAMDEQVIVPVPEVPVIDQQDAVETPSADAVEA